MGKEGTCNAGGTGDAGLIPGSDSCVEWGHWWLGQKPPALISAGPWGWSHEGAVCGWWEDGVYF